MAKVQMPFGVTAGFVVKVGLHQGSALSPLPFRIVMDCISKQIQIENGMKLIYADNIERTTDSEEELVQAIDIWNRN